jgi:hypothetical protein
MLNRLQKSFVYRSVLTDTLPYEVPVIFSNDRFHASLSAPPDGALEPIFSRLLDGRPSYTVPYNYSIWKDATRKTTLSIVHPLMQKSVAEFYELHNSGMLSHCARSKFSLRKPVALASPYAKEIDRDDDRDKSGIPQLLAEAGEADMAHMSSYFAYGKYNLLGKFVASREFIRLETRHALLRKIDISKCFYNIYTHSITWAVKSKPFAKSQKDTYSFESAFDKLMQRCNYNETNGIVVGPEFSRVFAEIIFQDIDECVEYDLKKCNLVAGLHYDIRRYVDDYFIFSSDTITLDKVESCLRHHLERYKLYVNERKIITQARPFVSPLTLARDEIAEKLRDVSSMLAQMSAATDVNEMNRLGKAIRSSLNTMRLSVARHQIEFANLSGWLMSRLRRIIRRVVKAIPGHLEPRGKEALGDVAVATLEAALYLCAVDLRVRTTYSLCQIALALEKAQETLTAEQNDLISHLLSDQITNLIKQRMVAGGAEFGSSDDIELANLLTCGAHFVGEDFLASGVVKDALMQMVSTPKLTYFNYITLAFCMRKSLNEYSTLLAQLHNSARQRVLSHDVDIMRDTEEYLIAVDYLSSPEVSPSDKQSFYKALFKMKNYVSRSSLEALGNHIGFSDWTGVTVEHQLRRKELRPVYAWG